MADYNLDELAALKRGRRISVCLPARNEEPTVGAVVARLAAQGAGRPVPLVDEILVVDDGSSDATAATARAAGARVVRAAEVLPTHGTGPGKGEALWKGLAEAEGDLIVFLDADLVDFDPGFVVGLLGPLLTTAETAMVKGAYARPLDGRAGEGGRVTELVARPLLSLLHPDVAGVAQPLGGEYAARREVLEQVPFVCGYGVEMGLLLDISTRFGAAALAQVDVGVRVHRNRTLAELAPQARAVIEVALARAGVPGVAVRECPPLAEVAGFGCRSA